MGQNAGNGVWYQVNLNSTIGWVAASVTRLEGDCAALPSIAAPVNARLAPTSPPVIQPTDAPPINPTTAAPSTDPTAVLPTNPTAVQSPRLPDLTISELDIFRNSDNNIVARISIVNNGTAPFTPDQAFSIITCVDGFDICTEVNGLLLPYLPPGATTYYTALMPAYSPNPNNIVNVTLDARSQVGELDESNNTCLQDFQRLISPKMP